MVVDLARHERADHEVRALEGLVHRRRLVQPAGDRLEVVDGDAARVEAAVPADHVERVVGVGVAGPAAAVPHQHLDVVAVDRQRLAGAAQVALAVRRVLEELAARATGSAAAGRCGPAASITQQPQRLVAAAAPRGGSSRSG